MIIKETFNLFRNKYVVSLEGERMKSEKNICNRN